MGALTPPHSDYHCMVLKFDDFNNLNVTNVQNRKKSETYFLPVIPCRFFSHCHTETGFST